MWGEKKVKKNKKKGKWWEKRDGGIGASEREYWYWLPNGGGGERLDEIGMEEKGWASTDTTKRESKKENELGRVSFNSTRRISFGWDEIQYNTIRYNTIQYQVFFTYTTQILSRTHGLVCFALPSRFHSSLPFLYNFSNQWAQCLRPCPFSPYFQIDPNYNNTCFFSFFFSLVWNGVSLGSRHYFFKLVVFNSDQSSHPSNKLKEIVEGTWVNSFFFGWIYYFLGKGWCSKLKKIKSSIFLD